MHTRYDPMFGSYLIVLGAISGPGLGVNSQQYSRNQVVLGLNLELLHIKHALQFFESSISPV